MLRRKSRGGPDVCADCGTNDPAWASVNRGVLLCDDCSCVHRTLGRHVSQVKSLAKDAWTPAQLAMVHTLYANGANNIWEHALLGPSAVKSGPRKPNSTDSVNPTKAEFIRAKYQTLSFAFRSALGADQPSEDDLSKQLHSSARTSNLETCLRQLSLGADPNYFHPEKGTRPLHVAAKAGQPAQVELLAAHGADPGARDWNGNTAVHYARSAGHIELAHRLAELQHELTDRLAQFVSGRKPDHLAGQHLIVPEMADSMDLSEFSKLAKRKLQSLANNLFEELAMDVYDEVDRRHNEEIWSSGALADQRFTVPFLPVNPDFSSTRNQGRQKLARFNAREFATLVIDVLADVKRRQPGMTSGAAFFKDAGPRQRRRRASDSTITTDVGAGLSDDEPLYDTVATSDDEAEQSVHSLGRRLRLQEIRPVTVGANEWRGAPSGSVLATSELQPSVSLQEEKGSPEVNSAQSSLTEATSTAPGGEVSAKEYDAVNRQLALAEARIQQLQQNNAGMKREIGQLHVMVQKLVLENTALKSQVQRVVQSQSQSPLTILLPNGHEQSPPTSSEGRKGAAGAGGAHPGASRPQSMYETRQHRRQNSMGGSRDDVSPNVILGRKTSEPNALWLEETVDVGKETVSPSSAIWSPPGVSQPNCLPTQEEALEKTRPVIRRIAELQALAKERRRDGYVTCAEKIHAAVLDLAGLFPEPPPTEQVHRAMDELTGSALRLHTETKMSLRSSDNDQVASDIMRRAFDTARNMKALITLLD